MKRKRIIICILVLLCLPAMAVFNEKDLSNTLSVRRDANTTDDEEADNP